MPHPETSPAVVPAHDAPRHRSWLYLLGGVAVAGGIGWVLDVTVLWLLDVVLHVPTSLAAAAGVTVSAIVNFLINRHVFSGTRSAVVGQAIRYAIVFVVNLAVVALALPPLSTALHGLLHNESFGLLAAKVILTAVMVPINAVLYRYWVYAHRTPRKDGETPS